MMILRKQIEVELASISLKEPLFPFWNSRMHMESKKLMLKSESKTARVRVMKLGL